MKKNIAYKKYYNDIIHCVFCHKCINLYYAKAHMKTKKCKALQEMIPKEESENLFLKFTREINRLKGELKLKEDDTEPSPEEKKT